MFIVNWIMDVLRPLLGLLASILAVVAMIAIWVVDASVLNGMFDTALVVIKWVSNQWDALNRTHQLIPSIGRGKIESALRFISGEKLLVNFAFTLVIRYIHVLVKWTFLLLTAPVRFVRFLWNHGAPAPAAP